MNSLLPLLWNHVQQFSLDGSFHNLTVIMKSLVWCKMVKTTMILFCNIIKWHEQQLFNEHFQMIHHSAFNFPVSTQSGWSLKDCTRNFNVFKKTQRSSDNEFYATFAIERPSLFTVMFSSTACKSGTCPTGRGSPVTDAVTYGTNPLYNVPIFLFDWEDWASVSHAPTLLICNMLFRKLVSDWNRCPVSGLGLSVPMFYLRV